MKANLPAQRSVSNGRNYWGEKACTSTLHAVVLHRDEMHTAVTVRIHHSRSRSRNYCSVWINDRHRYFAGHGQASGHGYHRPSAALAAALESCGIKLSEELEGRGDGAMRDAVTAICHALGYTAVHLVEN